MPDLARIAELYRIAPRASERIARGLDTENWRIDTDDTSYFLKAYPARSDRAAERAALVLAMHARSAGIRTPRVIADRDGQMLHDDGEHAYALFEFVANAAPSTHHSIEQMAETGAELARIHRALRNVRTSRPAETPAWMRFDLDARLGELDVMSQDVVPRNSKDLSVRK
jgi:Ser/Thr protein kinase RdoA (MazF antagonist)